MSDTISIDVLFRLIFIDEQFDFSYQTETFLLVLRKDEICSQ